MISRIRSHNNKPKRRVLGKILIATLAIVLLVCGAFFIRRLYYKSKHIVKGKYTDNGGAASELTYKGTKYGYNNDIETILLMGLDCVSLDEKPQYEGIETKGPRSDTMVLLILDRKKKSVKVLPISRDSMTSIDVFDYSGNYQQTIKEHLCLQYAFAGGGQKSGEYASKAVSSLLYSVPIDLYCAVDRSTVSELADMVGGVEVTVLETLYDDDGNVRFTEGETVTLKGQDAEDYIRLRFKDHSGGNDYRMQRQKQFLEAFLGKFTAKIKGRPKELFQAYNKLKKHMQTNVSAWDVLRLGVIYRKAGREDIEFAMQPGETKLNEAGTHDEFVVDEDAMYELVVKTFYKKK